MSCMGRIVSLIALVALAGCAAAPPAPQDQFYRLVVDDVSFASSSPLMGTVVVRRLSADGVLDQRAIAFADTASPQSLKHYNYHFWSDPPTHLVQQFLVSRIRQRALAEVVVALEVGVDGDYEVFGRIRRFEHLRHIHGEAVVALELGLMRIDDRQIVLLKDYQAMQTVDGDSPAGAVHAINAALEQVVTRFLNDLAAIS